MVRRDTHDLAGPGLGVRSLLARAVDGHATRWLLVLGVAAVVIVAVAAGGGSASTLYVVSALTGALAGLVVLPDGVVRLTTFSARVRAAALVVAGGLGWALVAVVVASLLRLTIGDDGGVGVGVGLLTLGSYVLGTVAALGFTCSVAVTGNDDDEH